MDQHSFEPALRGETLEPGRPDYEAARRVYNGMIDKRPRVIVQCVDAADVQGAVRYARDNHLLLAVRGGGHNGAGLASCDDGVVIDLRRMRGLRVDPAEATVRVEAGCVWGDVDHATHAFGLAVPTGVVSSTGVAGLTLGGGHGYLTRKYGMTVDNLLEADVVLADGRFVTASTEQNADLFWALRGGGGNFGVVTSFLFRARPVRDVYAGPMLWPVEQAETVLKWYRGFLPSAPDDVYGFFLFLRVPPGPPFPPELHGKTMCAIVWCYAGPMEQAEAALGALREVPPPAFAMVGPMPFPMLNSLFDALYPPGLQWYWKGDFFRELSDGAVREHLRYGPTLPTPLSTMHLYPIDGAANRVPRDATAFSYRDAKWSMVIAGIDPEPAHKDQIVGWARDYWRALHPYSAGGAYVNFMMDEGQDRVRATYREGYEHLVAVKRRYDPDNVFRVNQNIAP